VPHLTGQDMDPFCRWDFILIWIEHQITSCLFCPSRHWARIPPGRPTAGVTGGWAEKGLETGFRRSQENAENAVRTHRQLHALLGALIERQPRELKQAATAELTKLWHMTQTFAIDKKHNLPKHWPSESQSQWKNRLCQRM